MKPASPTQRRVARQATHALLALLLCAAPALAAPLSLAYSAEPAALSSPSSLPSFTRTSLPYGGEQDLTKIPERVDVWTQPSIYPGQLLNVYVSSPSPAYSISIKRETYAGGKKPRVVFAQQRVDGADQRNLITWDATTGTAHADWLLSFTLETTSWLPGVYTITTSNQVLSQQGRGIFVVKTPTIRANYPMYALSILTYQAYNDWGGASAYTQPRSVRLSMERPFSLKTSLVNGKRQFVIGGWALESAWAVWLSAHVSGLQYTTDYDLSLSAPPVNPSALILGRHTEYVTRTFRDWLDAASGDGGTMELAHFGTNSLYWQIRLEGGVESSAPTEIVVYKVKGQDPVELISPTDVTYLFRSAEIQRPEGSLLGTQYGVCCTKLPPTSMQIGSEVPARLLLGTGLQKGSVLKNLYDQEADFLYPTSKLTILGSALITLSPKKTAILATVIRTGERGARIFSAGSFMWVTGFTGTQPFGISRASFIRFNANILDWLGIKRHWYPLPPPQRE